MDLTCMPLGLVEVDVRMLIKYLNNTFDFLEPIKLVLAMELVEYMMKEMQNQYQHYSNYYQLEVVVVEYLDTC